MSKFNKESYERNKKKRRKSIYEKRQERREEARQYVWDYLSTHPCIDCGESDPRLLEFDHVKGKKVDLASQLANGRYSLESLVLVQRLNSAIDSATNPSASGCNPSHCTKILNRAIVYPTRLLK